MAKLSKAEAKAHAAACKILAQDRVGFDDAWAVYETWQESANHVNTIAGAFFTPIGLARDFAIEVGGRRIIDLCAGIGALSFMAYQSAKTGGVTREIVCVEKNPDYVAVGRKLLPEATWICGDVFDLPAGLGRFDCAIANPPFGATARFSAKAPRYTGRAFEYHVIDVASDLAADGVFIVPQSSAPFEYSGKPGYSERRHDAYDAFAKQTSIELTPNCGIDCSVYRDDWHGVAPAVEIVLADFRESAARRMADQPQPSLFAA